MKGEKLKSKNRNKDITLNKNIELEKEKREEKELERLAVTIRRTENKRKKIELENSVNSEESKNQDIENEQEELLSNDKPQVKTDTKLWNKNLKISLFIGTLMVIAVLIIIVLINAIVSMVRYNNELQDDLVKITMYSTENNKKDTTLQEKNAKEEISESDFTEAETSQELPEEETENVVLSELGIHRYELYKENVTWEEAYKNCKERGGYLLHINSDEEYEYLKKEIIGETYKDCRFFLGATREPDSQIYQWVDNNRNLYGDDLTGELYKKYWMNDEPSYSDTNTETEEYYLDFFYSKENDEWFWNDISNDIRRYYSGSIAYICEFED